MVIDVSDYPHKRSASLDDETNDIASRMFNFSKFVRNALKRSTLPADPKMAHDNPEIIELIEERLELGIQKYGHGVRAQENTQNFGTHDDTWVEMALEEVLDNLIYLTAEIIRIRQQQRRITPLRQDKPDTSDRDGGAGEQ